MLFSYLVAESLPVFGNSPGFNKDMLKPLNLARVTIRIIEYLSII